MTRVGASECGQQTSFNGAEGFSDIEGKVTRVGASERGQRMSFKMGAVVLNKPQIKGETKLPSAVRGWNP